jgi:NAD(P)H-dependent flavin oxidoreductase YrpB (nitropropane dioxygenase family)
VLAAYLARTPATTPDGFVLETAGAGGHSAPPRGRLRLDVRNEPVYGPRDEIDVTKVAADLSFLPELVAAAGARFSAADVIAHLLPS